MTEYLTVPDVVRELGLPPDKHANWAAGARVRERWRRLHQGQYPPKVLQEKTSSQGSHCFAIYPTSFRQIIVDIVEQEYGTSPQLEFWP